MTVFDDDNRSNSNGKSGEDKSRKENQRGYTHNEVIEIVNRLADKAEERSKREDISLESSVSREVQEYTLEIVNSDMLGLIEEFQFQYPEEFDSFDGEMNKAVVEAVDNTHDDIWWTYLENMFMSAMDWAVCNELRERGELPE